MQWRERLLPPAPGPRLRIPTRPLRWVARRRIDYTLEFRCGSCGFRLVVNRWALADFILRALEAHEAAHAEGRICTWRWQ